MKSSPDTSSPRALKIDGLTHRFGAVTALADASLEVAAGEIVSILGPSGCGKSTLLQIIAGHLTPQAGRITVAGQRVVDIAGGMAAVPPRHRGVGMVFQDYALFPHLTVAQNIAFGVPQMAARGRLLGGRRAARSDRQQRAAIIDELLATFAIEGMGERFPGELSGGQQQRVAIARALAQRPALLLLDEPFGNLDAATREHVRAEIVARLRATGVTCVFVTHDQEEALAISDRVAVMQSGRVLQVDDPETLYRRPFCAEVAEFLGRANLLQATIRSGVAHTVLGDFAAPEAADGEAQVLVRPELIDVHPDPAGSVVVASREFRGHDALYALALTDGSHVWAHRPSVEMADVGARVSLTLLPGDVAVLPGTHSPAGGSAADPATGRMASSQSGTTLTSTIVSAGSAASV